MVDVSPVSYLCLSLYPSGSAKYWKVPGQISSERRSCNIPQYRIIELLCMYTQFQVQVIANIPNFKTYKFIYSEYYKYMCINNMCFCFINRFTKKFFRPIVINFYRFSDSLEKLKLSILSPENCIHTYIHKISLTMLGVSQTC